MYILFEGVKLLNSCCLCFALQLVGTADVSSARGDVMCAEAIKKLKVSSS